MEVPGKVEMAPAVLFGAAAGAALPGAAGRRFAVASILGTAAVVSAFAFSGFCNHFPLYPFTTYINYHKAYIYTKPESCACVSRTAKARSRTGNARCANVQETKTLICF